jgi:hypothetical protein
MFDRVMPLQTPVLDAISTKDRRVQIQRVPKQDRTHRTQRDAHQRLGDLGEPLIGEAVEEAPQRIRRREARQAQQPGQQRVPAVPGEMLEPLCAQGQAVPPSQQHVHRRNLIVRGLDEGGEQRAQRRPEPHQLEVQPEQNGSGSDGDRVIGKREADLRVEW